MNATTILCPNCKSPISVDDALKSQIEDEFKKSLEQASQKHLEEEKERLRKQMLDWQEDEKRKLESQVDLESKALKAELADKDKKLIEAREQELKLRQAKNNLEKEKEEFELEKQRQIDGEREKIRKETAELMLEQHRLRDAEKDKQMDSMRRTIEELQLKANVTSQQLQGEVLELELEQILRGEFVYDEILPVPKGVSGADILQRVRNTAGQDCGMIVWESKRTKAWSEGWVQKLKDDLRVSKADVAVLVSAVMPGDVKNFGPRDGIYVTNYECLLSLAKFIRLSLIQLGAAKNMAVGKAEKMEMIYNYLSGNEFRGRVEAIIEAFSAMKKDLEDEKRAFIKIWAKREKEIERVINNTVGMHGDLQGLMGASLPQITTLEITSITIESE